MEAMIDALAFLADSRGVSAVCAFLQGTYTRYRSCSFVLALMLTLACAACC